MTAWLVILSVGAGSYALRVLPLALDGRWTRTPAFERTISLAGTAALAALVVSGLRRASATGTNGMALVITIAVALVMAIRGGSMFRILLTAGAAYALVQLVISSVT